MLAACRQMLQYHSEFVDIHVQGLEVVDMGVVVDGQENGTGRVVRVAHVVERCALPAPFTIRLTARLQRRHSSSRFSRWQTDLSNSVRVRYMFEGILQARYPTAHHREASARAGNALTLVVL